MENEKNLNITSDKVLDAANLELESYPVKVSTAGETVIADFKTKIEHDRILGIVCVDTQSVDSAKGLVNIEVSGQKIICQDRIHKFLIQKTSSLSLMEAAKKLDVPVTTSDVRILFQDQNTGSIAPYYVYFYALVSKRKM
jgi:hypothetical protein